MLPAHRLFTVDEYYRMVEASILHEDDRVEVIEGEIAVYTRGASLAPLAFPDPQIRVNEVLG